MFTPISLQDLSLTDLCYQPADSIDNETNNSVIINLINETIYN